RRLESPGRQRNTGSTANCPKGFGLGRLWRKTKAFPRTAHRLETVSPRAITRRLAPTRRRLFGGAAPATLRPSHLVLEARGWPEPINRNMPLYRSPTATRIVSPSRCPHPHKRKRVRISLIQ